MIAAEYLVVDLRRSQEFSKMKIWRSNLAAQERDWIKEFSGIETEAQKEKEQGS
jgi:hypothetical protein